MRPVNLYLLTRDIDKNTYTEFENILSARHERMPVKEHEFHSLQKLVDILCEKGVTIAQLDGFFYSYTIRQIGKEFDLLKISVDKRVLNIELKSLAVSKEKIEKQLLKNRYYLGTLADRLDMYTYVEETGKLYTLGEKFREASFDELIDSVTSFSDYDTGNPDQLLQAKNYLISPLNMPEEFLANRYFLTQQQEMIKKDILKALEPSGYEECVNAEIEKDDIETEKIDDVGKKKNENSGVNFWGITGIAGTGKTLLMYDLAKELSATGKVCVIHCGMLCEGHRVLNDMMENVDIVSEEDFLSIIDLYYAIPYNDHLQDNYILDNIYNESEEFAYKYILIDEAQRMSEKTLTFIRTLANSKVKLCVFSYDYFQILSKTEQRRNIPAKLAELSGFKELKLSGRIRSNSEMNSFIQTLLDQREREQNNRYNYENVDVLFAKDEAEAASIINFYRNDRGYTFIEYDEPLAGCSGDCNVLEAAGMEFEDVVITLTDHFRYSDDGVLVGNAHPNPDYSYYRLLFQSVSRTRERLCIVVIGDSVLFEKVLSIKKV